MKDITVALAGNQNSGKTTLFNQLTGKNQHVGNFPGVTVEHKIGTVKSHKNITIADLPGIYSLSPYTAEEIVSRDFIINESPDAILNIIDATNLQRNLYLTLQLIELMKPMVIALNMMDEVKAQNIQINIEQLSRDLGVPIVPISAAKNEGIDDLISALEKVVSKNQLPKKYDFCEGAVHRALHGVSHLIEDHAKNIGYPPRFTASKLIEGDPLLEEALDMSAADRDILMHIVDEMEYEAGIDREAAIADMRYKFIENVCADSVYQAEHKTPFSVKLDKILTHKIFAIPIFIGIMALIFWITFDSIGGACSDAMAEAIENLGFTVEGGLIGAGVSNWMTSFIIDGVFTGVGTVLSFLPLIIILFFFLSLLEDTGYMARIAFVMDGFLRKIGLSGRSFVPMLVGFGCSVPAIMSTRTLSSDRDRKMTIILTPFMSCGAKVPIYSVFAAALFANNQALVMTSMYVLGIIVAILSGLLLKKTVFTGNPVPFVLELPAYRMPSLKTVLMLVWERAKDFLIRAFTIIFLAAIVIWFLQSYDLTFHFVTDNSKSILADLGQLISPIFSPLGFGNWQAATSVVAGLSAKETVISTLAVLMGPGQSLQALFTPLTAYSFMAFILLYMPCFATMAATKREMGSVKDTAFALTYQTVIAWITAFLIFQIGTLCGLR